MARDNGPIKVWNRSDTVPLDGEGGYAGGDSTAAAVASALAQAGAAEAKAADAATIIGDPGGITETTVTDRNLNSAAMPAGWRAARMWVEDADASGLGLAWRVSTGSTLSVRNPRRVAVDDLAQVDSASTLDRF